MDKYFKISKIIAKSLEEALLPKEQEELEEWLNSSSGNRELYNEFSNEQSKEKAFLLFERFGHSPKNRRMVWQQGKIVKLRRSFIRITAAAAVLAIVVFSGILFLWPNENIDDIADATVISVPPGKSSAILTLATGEKLALDELSEDSILVSEGAINTAIVSNRQLSYMQNIVFSDSTLTSVDEEKPAFNVLEVPSKAEYRLVLSDGTKVALNANSTLKYPVQFSKHERRVEISGEAFFEVTHDSERPFRVVDVYGNQVEVKGTSFDVKAYPDESISLVALVEGAVVFQTKEHEQIDLTPGYGISFYSDDNTFSKKPVNIEEITAWKNGRFIFDDKPLEYIITNISRWYGIKLVYGDDDVRNIHFSIDTPRHKNLSALISLLESTESVRFEQKGQGLIVYSIGR
ncbi:MAG: FecR family protein [Draconibacterium sp.]